MAGAGEVRALERAVGRILAAWAALSVAGGAHLAFWHRRDPVVAAFGQQTAAWGAVDGLIALVAARAGRPPPAAPAAPADPAEPTERGDESAGRLRRLGRLLAVNAVLDVGYVAAGLALLRRARAGGPARLGGDGPAVVVQGAFLLVLDTTALAAVRRLQARVQADPDV